MLDQDKFSDAATRLKARIHRLILSDQDESPEKRLAAFVALLWELKQFSMPHPQPPEFAPLMTAIEAALNALGFYEEYVN